MPISAVTGKGVKELTVSLSKVFWMRSPEEKVVFEKEYMIRRTGFFQNEPYNVYADEHEDGLYRCRRPPRRTHA